MIIKILGIFDIFIGIVFWLFGIFHIIPNHFILIIGLFLLAKGIIFITGFSIASALDIICSVLIILASSHEFPRAVYIFVALFLLQKGAFSMLS